MEKKILIAVDGSIHSRKAIEYCIDICSIIKGMHYVLINIQPKISDFLIHESHIDPQAKAGLKEIADKNHRHSMKILDESMDTMIKLGINKKLIEKVSLPALKGTSKEILDYAKQTICDAVVVGNRGTTKFAEAFRGSIANNIIEYTDTIPVWAVGGGINSHKVMLAVDGSESSLVAVDHASFMFSGNTSIDITLMHVTPRLRDYCAIDFKKDADLMEEIIAHGDKMCIDNFYARAQKILTDAGIRKSQIHILEVGSRISIGRAIVKNAKKHGCTTLIVGRRGVNDAYFMGSVSRYVIANAKNCAVWLVP
ncbi:MAG: universal stress protein [Deltaproteobacteria bacterium]|nr:universal stress protein [Deltaproteobacteria bacterium]